MSGVLRRGTLNFDCANSSKSCRGNLESNLYGGYQEAKLKSSTPEISVIAIDFRRYSADLKKDSKSPANLEANVPNQRDLSQDPDSDVLSNYLGHYRRWSLLWTFLLSLFQIVLTFNLFGFVFQTIRKDFWCARPEHLTDIGIQAWKNLTQPSGSCSILNLDYQNIQNEEQLVQHLLSTPIIEEISCERFEFSTDQGSYVNLIEEFSLVCNRASLLNLVEMCFLTGAAAGSVVSGWISDRCGRKKTLVSFYMLNLVICTCEAFVNSLKVFMAVRFIAGFGSMTMNVVSFVLIVELVSGKWRTIVGTLVLLQVPFTYILTSGIAYFIRDWRTLQLALTLPSFLLLSICWWIPESPRWLLERRRFSELFCIIERAAKMNGTSLPENYDKILEASTSNPKQSDATNNNSNSNSNTSNNVTKSSTENSSLSADEEYILNTNPIIVVFGRLYLRKTCFTLIIWYTALIIYFGLTLHFDNLGGNIYFNSAVGGLIEAVSIFVSIFIIAKWGLRRPMIGFVVIPGICLCVAYFLPRDDNQSFGLISLALTSKCLIGATNAVIPVFTARQYHTVVRNLGVGLGNLASGIALSSVPLLWMLERYDPFLPIGVMGVCGLIGATAFYLSDDV